MTHLHPVKSAPAPRRTFNARFNAALHRALVYLKLDEVPHIKRVIVTVVGITVLLLGFVMIITPGPAVLVIPIGLAILGTEYAWARRWLRRARKMTRKAVSQTQRVFSSRPVEAPAEAARVRETDLARDGKPPR